MAVEKISEPEEYSLYQCSKLQFSVSLSTQTYTFLFSETKKILRLWNMFELAAL